MKNSPIFVIGGSGFVGREFIKTLKKSGYKKIISASRSIPKNKISGVEYFAGVDLARPKSLENSIHKDFIIVNLAGFVSFRRKDRAKLFEINARGVLELLKICEQKKVCRFIQISSVAAFGFGAQKISETTKFEWSKYRFLNYSHSKFFANSAIDDSKLSTNILFPPLVIGVDDQNNVPRIFDFVRNKKRIFVPDGSNAFIDVRDLTTAIRLVIEKARTKENFLVVGENVSSKKLFATAIKILGQKTAIKILPQKMCLLTSTCARVAEFFGASVPAENIFLGFQKRIFDSQKICRELGFRPKSTLEKSLRDAFKKFKK